MKTAIYPGSFDPITLGHINIIKRAAQAFDKVIVCVMVNSKKNGGLFTPEERIALMRKSMDVENVEFDVSYDLVAEYAKAKGSRVLVKGLRVGLGLRAGGPDGDDQQQGQPRAGLGVFPSDEEYTYLSSTVVKELARYHANLDEFLPREIVEDVKNKLELRSDDCDGSRQH
ncbi:MAG: pantetheine-phosphate adenylyltransferase [Evtepia sp.]